MQSLLSEAEIEDVLSTETFGHLAYCDDGRPFVLPMAYVFLDGAIYGQTSVGRKVDALRRNPSACFQVQRQDGSVWRSVLCWGRFEELALDELNGPEAVEIVRGLSERLAGIQKGVGVSVPFEFGAAVTALHLNDRESTLFRIVIDERSGRAFGS